jgi:hypothetical protein
MIEPGGPTAIPREMRGARPGPVGDVGRSIRSGRVIGPGAGVAHAVVESVRNM